MAFRVELAPRNTGVIPLPPSSPNFELPFHSRKKVIKLIRFEEGKDIEDLWNGRSVEVEKRVQAILSNEPAVKKVEMNQRYAVKSDLTVHFAPNFLLDKVKVEVKSSWMGIKQYKQKVREELPEDRRSEEDFQKWLTNHEIILVNGSEFKKPKEILEESFYPQLERIVQKRLATFDFSLLNSF